MPEGKEDIAAQTQRVIDLLMLGNFDNVRPVLDEIDYASLKKAPELQKAIGDAFFKGVDKAIEVGELTMAKFALNTLAHTKRYCVRHSSRFADIPAMNKTVDKALYVQAKEDIAKGNLDDAADKLHLINNRSAFEDYHELRVAAHRIRDEENFAEAQKAFKARRYEDLGNALGQIKDFNPERFKGILKMKVASENYYDDQMLADIINHLDKGEPMWANAWIKNIKNPSRIKGFKALEKKIMSAYERECFDFARREVAKGLSPYFSAFLLGEIKEPSRFAGYDALCFVADNALLQLAYAKIAKAEFSFPETNRITSMEAALDHPYCSIWFGYSSKNFSAAETTMIKILNPSRALIQQRVSKLPHATKALLGYTTLTLT